MILFDADVVAEGVSFEQQFVQGFKDLATVNWTLLLARLLTGLIGAAVMVLLVKWLDFFIKRALAKYKSTSLLANFIRKLVKYVLWAVIAIWFLGHVGLDMKPMLAGIGVTGVVLGLAMQETLGNFFSGLMIIVNQPFKIGDYIETGSFSGTVTDMDMNRIVLLTPDNKRITMSNKLVWGNPVVNYSAMDKRRVDMVASVSYDADIPKAKQVITEIIASYPEVLPNPAPTVEVGTLGDSSIDFIVRPWVRPADYWKVLWRFQAEIYPKLDAAGIDVPYDQLDVHIVEMPKQK